MAKWLSLKDNPLEFDNNKEVTIYDVAMRDTSLDLSSFYKYVAVGKAYVYKDGIVKFERYDQGIGSYITMKRIPTHYILLEDSDG